jgi:chromosome segregation ATPase
MAGKSYKYVPRTTTLESAVADAFSEFQTLAEEMEEWRSNMEEKFSQTERYSRVEEVAQTLENHTDAPDIPESVSDEEVVYSEAVNRSKREGPSRAVRCENACAMLDAAISRVEEIIGEIEDKLEAFPEGADEHEGEKREDLENWQSELETFRDELSEHKDECESLDFPSMYG